MKVLESTIQNARKLLNDMFAKVKLCLNGRDMTIDSLERLKLEERIIQMKDKTETAALSAAVSVATVVGTFLIGPIAANIGGAAPGAIITEGVLANTTVLKEVQYLVDKDKKQSETVKSAFQSLRDLCSHATQDCDLPFLGRSINELFGFFIYCAQCTEGEILHLVEEAQKRSNFEWHSKMPYYTKFESVFHYANFSLNIQILSVDIFSLFAHPTKLEHELADMIGTLMVEREKLISLVFYLIGEGKLR